MRHLLFFTLLVLATACTNDKNAAVREGFDKDEALAKLSRYEDSVKLLTGKPQIAVQYANKCLEFYRAFPQSEEAPKYLDKAHMILSSAGYNQQAALYADTLIKNYPKYGNRSMVLMSQATAYDMFIVPRDKQKAIHYYNLWLKENPNAPADQRDDVEFRLAHIDQTYDQMLEDQMNKMSAK